MNYSSVYRQNGFLTYFLTALVLLVFIGMKTSGSIDKNLVKTASICKIADFIDWPSSPEVFYIVFLSKEEDLSPLGTILLGQTIKGKPVTAQYTSTIKDIEKADILYISNDFNTNIKDVVSAFAEKPVLLVGETKDYGNKGVHINFFVTKGGTLHFELNPEAFHQSGLRVNNMLIEYAKIVK